eukprot:15481784-Alexandrium_andersonii.AAC.1
MTSACNGRGWHKHACNWRSSCMFSSERLSGFTKSLGQPATAQALLRAVRDQLCDACNTPKLLAPSCLLNAVPLS